MLEAVVLDGPWKGFTIGEARAIEHGHSIASVKDASIAVLRWRIQELEAAIASVDALPNTVVLG